VAFIILLSALPRLADLGVFTVVDESDRWRWATEFFQALTRGDLAGTLVGDGYPGIFPAWLESLWLGVQVLWRSAQRGALLDGAGVWLLIHEWSRDEFIAAQRLPIAAANALLVVLIYLLARRIFSDRVALLGGILIALDPFYLSDSRVNRADALITGIMTVSVLSLIIHLQGGRRRYLLLSGLAGGLALLTKSQALILLPIIVLIAALYQLSINDWRRLFAALAVIGLTWTLTAAITYVLLWPATWVRPGDTFSLVVNYASRKTDTEGVNTFFLGQPLRDQDPGPLFYPVVFLLRLTPLAALGLLGIAWAGFREFRPPKSMRLRRSEGAALALALYALLYGAIMTLGSHKQDRYLMPVFPAVDLLAAVGLAWLWQQACRKWKPDAGGRLALAGGALALLVQAAVVLPYHPYYYPYFNPLLGGGKVAVGLVRVGWGEGLDQAARYLNGKPDARQLVVASRLPGIFRAFFDGNVVHLDSGGEWLQADYVVFYVQQVQRMQDPGPGVIRYFQQHRQPEQVINLGGIDYAWIYPAPVAHAADPQRSLVVGKAALFGYNWAGEGGETLPLRLYWEQQGLAPGERLAVRLVGRGGQGGGWAACDPAPGFESAARQPGEVVESTCTLAADERLLPGLYDLAVGIQSDTGKAVGQFDFPGGLRSVSLEAGGKLTPVSPQMAQEIIASESIPADAWPVDLSYSPPSRGADEAVIRLLAYRLTTAAGKLDYPNAGYRWLAARPGEEIDVTLYWQALAPPAQDYHLFLHLFGRDDAPVGQLDVLLGGDHPSGDWRPGEVVTETYRLSIAGDAAAPTVVRLDAGLFILERMVALPAYNSQGRPAPTAIARFKLLPASWPTGGEHRLGVTLGEAVTLLGYDLSQAGESIAITLYWRAEAPLDEDYTVFVHLLGPGGKLRGQGDAPPVGGNYPTSWWAVGEVIADGHTIPLADSLEPGSYGIKVGLYRLADGQRLATAEGADGIELGPIAIPAGTGGK
jgi:hypothetical protein